MYEDFFEMKKTPFVRSIPVDDLYMDQDTEEIHNRLLYATRRQLFALVIGDPGTGIPRFGEPEDHRCEKVSGNRENRLA